MCVDLVRMVRTVSKEIRLTGTHRRHQLHMDDYNFVQSYRKQTHE